MCVDEYLKACMFVSRLRPMDDTLHLKELGSKLVEEAQLNEEFSFQRGLINELFPYIFEASKRMSSRGISRWLEANGTKLSAVTIAKALRDPEPLWQEILDDVEPAALRFEKAHNVKAEDFLKSAELFHHLKQKSPTLEVESGTDPRDQFEDYDSACAKLEAEWFSMPELAIDACLASAKFGGKESGDNDQPSNKK